MEYTIEKNVKIPSHVTGRMKYPWSEMEIGDSFFIEGKHTRNITGAAQNYGSHHNIKFTCRTVDGGVRVWRIA